MKRGYSVENILKMLSGNNRYYEIHNAVLDAEDELRIMQLLGHGLSEYEIALISDKNVSMEEQQSNDKFSRVIEQQQINEKTPREVEQQQINEKTPREVEQQRNNVKSSSITINESKKKRGILSWFLGERKG